MFSDDDILRRAYARLLALRDNLPERPHVNSRRCLVRKAG